MEEVFITLGEIPDSKEDVVILSWCFTCSICHQARTAHVFESGVVFDLKDGQIIDVNNLEIAIDKKTFKNLYLIQGVSDALKVKGIRAITQDVADLHAQSFHGLENAEVGIAN